MTFLSPPRGPCRQLQYALLISFTTFLALTSAASSSHRACYFPNGTEAISNVDIWPYLPCSPNKPHSMCCRTNSTDTCNTDGICESDWDGNLWRDFCTDPTWQAPACTKLCLGSSGTDGDGKTGGSVRVTQCSNGSYCCGVGSNANECCNTGSGVWIAKNGQTTNVNPASATTRSTGGGASQSSTSSTTQATSSTQTSSTAQAATPVAITSPSPTSSSSSSKSSTPTGAIAGGVVGGVVAIALIALAALLLRRQRKNERLANEKRNHDNYTQEVMRKQQQPQMYGEMDGQGAKVEMEGGTVGHEMGGQGFYGPKGGRAVHELQS